jgi:hypothetical protein
MLTAREIDRARVDEVMQKVRGTIPKKDRSLVEMLERVSTLDGVDPVVGKYLVDASWASDSRQEREARLAAANGSGKLWAEMAARYLEGLAQDEPGKVAKFIDANAERLRAETVSFGAVSFHLANLADAGRMRKWFDGWQARGNVTPWMLWNLAVVLWRSGAAAEAEEANRAAIELAGDDSTNGHLTVLGLAALKRGDVDEAQRARDEINPAALSGWDRYIYDVLAECLMAIERVEAADADGAKAIVGSVVGQIISADPKAADRFTLDLLYPAVDAVLGRIGDKWFTFRTKARIWFYRLK